MKEKTLVVIGADLNCYNVARAYHEAYGKKAYCFGRYPMSTTMHSTILHFKAIPTLEEDDVLLKVLNDFAQEHSEEELYLMGCTDQYADMLIRLRNQLPMYHCPMPPKDIYLKIQKKAEFYEECEKYGIAYPDTVVVNGVVEESEVTEEKLGFAYPIVVKPSFSAEYFLHEFEGMKKVYFSHSPEETISILKEVYAHGYTNRMILQKMVPGGDSNMRVLTCFSDKNGKVRAMCLGHTMVEEHTPTGLGNHAAIVTEDVTKFPMAEKIRHMLEDMKYTGFSNFDIKQVGDTDDFRCFEINLRQGRSNYYVTGAGINVVKLVMETYEDGKEDLTLCTQETFWRVIPSAVAFKYTEDKALVAKAKQLQKQGKCSSSLEYKKDMFRNPMRFAFVMEQLRRQFKKFKKYYPVKPE